MERTSACFQEFLHSGPPSLGTGTGPIRGKGGGWEAARAKVVPGKPRRVAERPARRSPTASGTEPVGIAPEARESDLRDLAARDWLWRTAIYMYFIE
jgi:hypothetical protein